jgi:hypothetical protein
LEVSNHNYHHMIKMVWLKSKFIST